MVEAVYDDGTSSKLHNTPGGGDDGLSQLPATMTAVAAPLLAGVALRGAEAYPAAVARVKRRSAGLLCQQQRDRRGLELNNTGSTNTLIGTPNFVMPTLPTGYTNSAMAIAQKQFLYVPYSSTSSSPSLFAWSIDGTTGALTPLAGSPFAATYAAGLASASQPTAPIITNGSGGNVSLYCRHRRQARLMSSKSPPRGIPTLLLFQTTSSIPPWNLSMDGLGKFLYVAEGTAAGEGVQMEVFSINSTTGALSGGTTMPLIQHVASARRAHRAIHELEWMA